MNADEAQKCLLVAQRLLAQANTADVEAANAALERATKYAEKGKRLDADGAGPLADELLGRIAARKRSLGSDGASSQNAAPGSGSGSARASAPGDRRTDDRSGRGGDDTSEKTRRANVLRRRWIGLVERWTDEEIVTENELAAAAGPIHFFVNNGLFAGDTVYLDLVE